MTFFAMKKECDGNYKSTIWLNEWNVHNSSISTISQALKQLKSKLNEGAGRSTVNFKFLSFLTGENASCQEIILWIQLDYATFLTINYMDCYAIA